jgi:hypothetical protein
VSSGLLAVYYLFVHPRTRLWHSHANAVLEGA